MSKPLCVLLLVLFTIATTPSRAQLTTCRNYVFKTPITTTFKKCVDLPALGSFLHYNYYPATSTLEIAYRQTGLGGSVSSKWVAWALNPVGKTMVGSQSLVAYRNAKDGSMVAYTTPITSYSTDLAKGELSFNVTNLSALSLNDEIIILATLKVPNNRTVLNQVWQDGPLSKDGKPLVHDLSGPNVRSMASLNLVSGASTTVDGGSRMKNVHGLLSGLSWGTLMLSGAIIARYMRFFPSADPTWFYLHVGCQMLGYIIGLVAWTIGTNLDSASTGIVQSLHSNIGMAIFILATIQMFALLIRPKKDHKYRFYWNVYHHSFAYTIIILSIINVFEGFKILNPKEMWKTTYIGVIVALALIAVLLEGFTWYLVFKRKKYELEGSKKPTPFSFIED